MATEKERRFTCADIPKRSFQFFKDMRNKKEHCDVTFQVENESIFAHRIIISAVIPSFRDILLNKNVQGEEEGISMPEIDPMAFKSLIEFAYGYELTIDTKNVKNLLTAACYLGVDEVQEACCDFMGDILELDNVMNTREFAQNLNCSELMEITDCYVREHFDEISKIEDFLNWPFTYLKELISQDDLNVDDESQVLEAVLRWTKYCPEERSSELPHLLRVVRMPLIEPMYLTQIVEKEEFLRRSTACRDLIDEAKTYKLFPEIRKSICSFSVRPRLSMKTSEIQDSYLEDIYNFHYEIKFTVQHFDLVEQKWFTGKSKIFYENFGSATVWRKKMYYFVWGYAVQYDPVDNSYQFLNYMPTPRSFVGASCLKNRIYVCGGGSGTEASNVVECFDPENNEWSVMSPMRVARSGPSVVTVGEYMYVLGGRDDSSVHDSVERYDPATDKWRTVSSMLTTRCYAGAAVLDGKIYVCGGRTLQSGDKGITNAEVYDPVKNKWKLISSMITARHTFTLLSCDSKLYAIGGKYDGSIHLHEFEIYVPEDDEWIPGPSTYTTHSTSAAVVMQAV